ncbi:ABC transporter permease [Hominisplanchenecus murintestinalis]|uniref:ABC transporter permease n=1 Tax=Hominisplanchenecus murintestinalis TaxID=2941517 RepID=A0AC61QUF6_9FIRM|nr:ABC transporter permease [Hominisplanchenecus murintestinalis]TGX96137.1 ABC transporter permease [Hominisplanchenecus murintestinalis]
MFWHNFKYTVKTLLGDKMLIFWTFAFPVILGAFFYMAFSDIEDSEKLHVIDIAVVENTGFRESEMWKESLEALSDEASGEQVFCTKYVSEEEAKRLLSEKEIAGYFMLADGEPQVTVASDGINETVLKYVVEEIYQTEEIVRNTAERRIQQGEMPTAEFYEQLSKEVMNLVDSENGGIRDISGANLSYTIIEFYTLIAMTCLYGGILGMVAVNQNLANMSSKGKRVSVSPVGKSRMILSSVLAGYVIQMVGVALLFAFTIFVLHVDYGNHLPLIVLLALCGGLAGLSVGIAIAVLVKSGDNVKTGIVISVTMAGCFLSGMMGITMKYLVDKNIPLLNLLNPANMITDGLYALYYYDTFDRYWQNAASLLVFAFSMILFSVLGLRRQKYDSI